MKNQLLLSGLLLSFGVSLHAAVGDTFTVGDLNYAILSEDDHTVSISGYQATLSGDMEIPSSITHEGSTFSVKEIGADAFFQCGSLTSVRIPDSVTKIGYRAFGSCSNLASALVSNSVTEIEDATFSLCSNLSTISLPNSLNRIGAMAFQTCTSLTSIVIPGTVTSIGNFAFYGCELKKIVALPTTTPSAEYNSFFMVSSDAVIYVPKGTIEQYSKSVGWNDFKDFREMGELVITLSESNLSIQKDKNATIAVTVSKDEDVSIESEIWSSSNNNVATVDNGVITAVAKGSATITFTLVDGYGRVYNKSCDVIVTESAAIENIEVDGNESPAKYYNLNGIYVNSNNLTPGIYIKRQGSKSTTVIVK